MEVIISSINNYFNNVLKNYLGYPETYNIDLDSTKQRIILRPNFGDSKLFNLLSNKELRVTIEQTLLLGFKNIDNDVFNVNVYTFKSNEIVITYTYGDNPLNLREIGILAKLVTEYDISRINEICIINSNFAKACTEELFWWEIIKNKYPEYYKEKRTNIYNVKEVLRGLEYYKNKEYFHPEDITNYPETFRYLLLEGIYRLNKKEIKLVTTILSEENTVKNMEMLRYIISNYDFMGVDTSELFFNLLFNKNFDENFLNEITQLLRIKNIELYNIERVKDARAFIIQGHHPTNTSASSEDRIRVYDWIDKKLNSDDNTHLEEFYFVISADSKLFDHILSKISDKISREKLYNILNRIIYGSEFYKFEKLYLRFKWKLTSEDIKNLTETAGLIQDRRFYQLLKME